MDKIKECFQQIYEKLNNGEDVSYMCVDYLKIDNKIIGKIKNVGVFFYYIKEQEMYYIPDRKPKDEQ